MSIVLPIIILLNLALGVWLSGQFGLGPRSRQELLTALGTFEKRNLAREQEPRDSGSSDRTG